MLKFSGLSGGTKIPSAGTAIVVARQRRQFELTTMVTIKPPVTTLKP
jgi:hypothetical protein